MARYSGPVCRLCRKIGEELYLKGSKCAANRCSIRKRNTRPGMHPERVKMTEHAVQLREKQKIKYIYGILEKQFLKYFKEASSKKGVVGELLLQFLERRLDNVVYRLGFAPTRRASRQLVRHGHILLNGKCVDIPSLRVAADDLISIVPKMKEKEDFKELVKRVSAPSWLAIDKETLEARVIALPTREAIDYEVNEELIIAFYSK